MKKLTFVIIILMTLLTAFAMQFEGDTQKLADILEMNPKDITKISLSTPTESDYNSTTNKDKIHAFIRYMDKVNYKKIRGNEPSSLPMTASMIYMYEKSKVYFIVSFENKVMIDHNFFEVKNGRIENDFLIDYYKSIE